MLSGVRVLVVEDDPAIAAEGQVVGPVGGIREAQQLVKGGALLNAAVLDLSLKDGDATPVLEALCARNIAVVVCTGGSGLLPGVRERHPEVVVLQKPVQPGRLIGEIQKACRGAKAM
jgi:DNA-binding NtrC family response regulator